LDDRLDAPVLLPALRPWSYKLADDWNCAFAKRLVLATAAEDAFADSCDATTLARVAVAALLAFDRSCDTAIRDRVTAAAILALPLSLDAADLVFTATAADDRFALNCDAATRPRVTRAAELALLCNSASARLETLTVAASSSREENAANPRTVLAGGLALMDALPPAPKDPFLVAVPAPRTRPKTPNLGPPVKPAVGGNMPMAY